MRSLFLASLLIVLPSSLVYYFDIDHIAVQSLSAGSYLIGLAGFCFFYYRMMIAEEVDYKLISMRVAPIILGVFFIMPPLLSQDVWVYILQGQLAVDGIFTYSTPSNNLLNDFVQYVDGPWKECPNHYGPVPMFFFWLTALIGQSSPLMNVLLIKIFIGLTVFGFYKVIPLIAESLELSDAYRPLVFIILNPVFLIQGVGQMHLDLFTGLVLSIFTYFLILRRYWFVGISIGVLGATKSLLFVLALGLAGVYLIYESLRKVAFMIPLLKIGMSAIVTIIVCYSFVWEGMSTIMTPLTFHEAKEPVKSLTEIFSYIFVGVQEMPKDLSLEQYNNQMMANKIAFSKSISLVFKLLALIFCLSLFVQVLTLRYKREVIIHLGKILLMVFIFYSAIMHSWYFLLVLPFLAFYEGEKYILKYAVIVFGLSCTYEIANILPTHFLLKNMIMVVFTIISVISYYLFLSKMTAFGKLSTNLKQIKSSSITA